MKKVGEPFRLGISVSLVALCFAIGLRYREVDVLLPGGLWMLGLILSAELVSPRWKPALGIAACVGGILAPQTLYYLPAILLVTRRTDPLLRIGTLVMPILIRPTIEVDLLVVMALMIGLILIIERIEERYQRYRADYLSEADAHLEYERLLTEVEASRLQELERRSKESVLEERNRIARSLHDYIGHTVSSAIMQLEAYKAVHQNVLEQSGSEAQLQTVIDTLKSGMVDIRSSIHHLHDDSIDMESHWEVLIARFPRLKISVSSVDPIGLDFDQKSQILRIAGECVANTVKHSDATKVRIILARTTQWYALTVRDDGSIDPGEIRTGIGLRGMRAFAEAQGGHFDCGYDRGFYVHLRIRGRRDMQGERTRAAKRPPAALPHEAVERKEQQ